MAQVEIDYILLAEIRTKFWYDIIKTTYKKEYHGWASESRVYHNQPIDYIDIHDPRIELNTAFIDDTFDKIPQEALQLMDITKYLEELSLRYKDNLIQCFYMINTKITYSYLKQFGRIGEITITYSEKYIDADTECMNIEQTIVETYVIPGVIYANYKYYTLTPEFIAWCQQPDKPKRATWFETLTYQ